MDKIKIQNIRIYAYHGIHEVETLVGQWYVVNVELNGDFSTAKQNKDLSGTSSLRKSFSLIQSGSVEVVKEYPPVKGVGGVAVVVDI